MQFVRDWKVNGKLYCYRHHQLSWSLTTQSFVLGLVVPRRICLPVCGGSVQKVLPATDYHWISWESSRSRRPSSSSITLRAPLGLISEAVIGLKFWRCRGRSKQKQQQQHHVSQCWNKFCGHPASGKLINYRFVNASVHQSWMCEWVGLWEEVWLNCLWNGQMFLIDSRTITVTYRGECNYLLLQYTIC